MDRAAVIVCDVCAQSRDRRSRLKPARGHDDLHGGQQMHMYVQHHAYAK